MFGEVMVELRSSVTAQLQVCGDRVGRGRRKAKGPGRKENAGLTWMQVAYGHELTSLTRLKKLFNAGLSAGELEQFCCWTLLERPVILGLVEAQALCWGAGDCLQN